MIRKQEYILQLHSALLHYYSKVQKFSGKVCNVILLRVGVSCVFFLLLFLSVSCKPSVPSGILSQSKMEEVLYDYHLAQGAAECGEGDMQKNRYLYVQKVFEKHGITEAEFDSSMVWYSANSDILFKMYKSLSERFEGELKGLGVGVSETELYANMSDVGDTANIWSGSRMVVLDNSRTNNLRTITLSADTTFRPGDNYKLSFAAQLLGDAREGFVLLSVQYKDKKKNAAVMRVSSSPNNMLNLPKRTDCDDYETEKINITFFCPTGNSSKQTSYLCIMNPALLRMHPVQDIKKTEKNVEKTDSLEVVSAPTDTNSHVVDTNPQLSPEELRNNKEVTREINIRNDRPVVVKKKRVQRQNVNVR